jgi:hypothetical protein
MIKIAAGSHTFPLESRPAPPCPGEARSALRDSVSDGYRLAPRAGSFPLRCASVAGIAPLIISGERLGVHYDGRSGTLRN